MKGGQPPTPLGEFAVLLPQVDHFRRTSAHVVHDREERGELPAARALESPPMPRCHRVCDRAHRERRVRTWAPSDRPPASTPSASTWTPNRATCTGTAVSSVSRLDGGHRHAPNRRRASRQRRSRVRDAGGCLPAPRSRMRPCRRLPRLALEPQRFGSAPPLCLAGPPARHRRTRSGGGFRVVRCPTGRAGQSGGIGATCAPGALVVGRTGAWQRRWEPSA